MSVDTGVTIRTSFASIHIRNAVLLRDDAREIEAIYRHEESSNVPAHASRKHRSYVTNSVLSSVAFLETLAKEFVDGIFEDEESTESGTRLHYPDLDPSYRKSAISCENLDN